jgi:hypothetical protein
MSDRQSPPSGSSINGAIPVPYVRFSPVGLRGCVDQSFDLVVVDDVCDYAAYLLTEKIEEGFGLTGLGA